MSNIETIEEEPVIKGIVVDHSHSGLASYDVNNDKQKKSGVTKLLLHGNRLTEVSGLMLWRDTLSYADFSHNTLSFVPFFAIPSASWPSLTVIKMPHNRLRHLTPSREAPLVSLPKLAALILNDNDLSSKSLSALPSLPQLNTLVISKNARLSSLKHVANRCPSLKKLSASNTGVAILPGSFSTLHLKELRLAHTKVAHLSDLPSLPQLQIIDLKEAPIAAEGAHFERNILSLMPNLRVVNGKNLRPSSARSKVKRTPSSGTLIDSGESETASSSNRNDLPVETGDTPEKSKSSHHKDPIESQPSRSDSRTTHESKKAKQLVKEEKKSQKRDRSVIPSPAETSHPSANRSESGVIQHTQIKRARKRDIAVNDALEFLCSNDQPILKW